MTNDFGAFGRAEPAALRPAVAATDGGLQDAVARVAAAHGAHPAHVRDAATLARALGGAGGAASVLLPAGQTTNPASAGGIQRMLVNQIAQRTYHPQRSIWDSVPTGAAGLLAQRGAATLIPRMVTAAQGRTADRPQQPVSTRYARPAGPGGALAVDGSGLVTSTGGGPIRFPDRASAEGWIRGRRGAGSAGQALQATAHPDGRGVTVRQAGAPAAALPPMPGAPGRP